MHRYNGNDSSIGTGTHLEKHYYRSSIAKKSKCLYYDNKSKKCLKVGIYCVGPSHYMCTKYRPIKPQSDHIKEEKDSYVGKIVVDKAQSDTSVARYAFFTQLHQHVQKMFNFKVEHLFFVFVLIFI